MGLNDYFDKIYCINLKERKDRWKNALNQFNKFNIKVERFEAINGNELEPNGRIVKEAVGGKLLGGEIGIIRSNYHIIKDAKAKNYKQIIIFEDDVVLAPEFDKKFIEHYNLVPPDWAFLYMGGNHTGGLQPINSHTAKIRYTFAIHAICVKNILYDHILAILEKEKEQVDVSYAKLQQLFPSYVTRPHLAWQQDGHSDIQGGYQNYDFLK